MANCSSQRNIRNYSLDRFSTIPDSLDNLEKHLQGKLSLKAESVTNNP